MPPKSPQSPLMVAVFLLAGCLGYSNSAVNPILYAFLSDNFKKSFMKACVCAEQREVNKALAADISLVLRGGGNNSSDGGHNGHIEGGEPEKNVQKVKKKYQPTNEEVELVSCYIKSSTSTAPSRSQHAPSALQPPINNLDFKIDENSIQSNIAANCGILIFILQHTCSLLLICVITALDCSDAIGDAVLPLPEKDVYCNVNKIASKNVKEITVSIQNGVLETDL